MAIEFLVCTVQALNGIGRVDDFPDIVGEFENRAYHIPVLGPALHGDCGTLATVYYSNCWNGSCCRYADGDCSKESSEGISRELLGYD